MYMFQIYAQKYNFLFYFFSNLRKNITFANDFKKLTLIWLYLTR